MSSSYLNVILADITPLRRASSP